MHRRLILTAAIVVLLAGAACAEEIKMSKIMPPSSTATIAVLDGYTKGAVGQSYQYLDPGSIPYNGLIVEQRTSIGSSTPLGNLVPAMQIRGGSSGEKCLWLRGGEGGATNIWKSQLVMGTGLSFYDSNMSQQYDNCSYMAWVSPYTYYSSNAPAFYMGCTATGDRFFFAVGAGNAKQPISCHYIYLYNSGIAIHPWPTGYTTTIPAHKTLTPYFLNYALYVEGPTYCSNTWWKSSDLRLKKNIENLTGVSERIGKLNGVKFDWRVDEFPEENFSEGRQIGVIAQDAEKEFPELVYTFPGGKKTFAYDRFTAVLLQAVKEQQKIIDAKRADIELLKKEITELKSIIQK